MPSFEQSYAAESKESDFVIYKFNNKQRSVSFDFIWVL